jgi:hypothetical protein
MDGALGPIIFQGGLGSMNTFHAVSKTKKQTYVKHRIIQQNDLVESAGADPIEGTLQMHFHAPYTLPPSAALTALEALMDMQIPVPLIIGSTPIGRGFITLFVIEEIQSKMSKFISASWIVGDIDVRLLEYPNAISLSGPLSALGGALPGLSGAVASVTGAIAGTTGVLNIASSASAVLGANIGSALPGAVSGILNTLTGAHSANSLTSMLTALTPGAVAQLTAPSAQTLSTAISNLHIAGH